MAVGGTVRLPDEAMVGEVAVGVALGVAAGARTAGHGGDPPAAGVCVGVGIWAKGASAATGGALAETAAPRINAHTHRLVSPKAPSKLTEREDTFTEGNASRSGPLSIPSCLLPTAYCLHSYRRASMGFRRDARIAG